MTDSASLTIRSLRPEDQPAWRELWTKYLEYYETRLPEAVFTTTFARLLSKAPGEFSARIALMGGRLVGLVHYLFHGSTWKAEEVCYLQDLYTLPEVRGLGVGRALIETVYAEADAAGAPTVYWFTQDFNARARRLYDSVGVLTPFIRYNRVLPAASIRPTPARGITIRPPIPTDEPAWRRLWADYLSFYETDLPESVTRHTFARVAGADSGEMRGLIAEIDGAAVGLVHFVGHRSCWKVENVCYLQDLFVAPPARGRGLGRALIEAVYADADRRGTPAVYWLTQSFNSTARALYDQVAAKTPFIEYDRPEK